MSSCSNIVTVDIDIPYTLFRKVFFERYVSVVEYIYTWVFNIEVVSIRAFPSRTGNTHIYIEVKKCISPETNLVLQFFSYSDHKRWVLNYERLKNLGRQYDRLFPI